MASAPIATIDQWHSPLLLVQADNDGNIEHDVIMMPNEIHDMARYSSWMMFFNAPDVSFRRHLDTRSAPAARSP